MHQQLRDAHVEPQPELSVLWNGGTDGARAVHADAAKHETADANRREAKGKWTWSEGGTRETEFKTWRADQ